MILQAIKHTYVSEFSSFKITLKRRTRLLHLSKMAPVFYVFIFRVHVHLHILDAGHILNVNKKRYRECIFYLYLNMSRKGVIKTLWLHLFIDLYMKF